MSDLDEMSETELRAEVTALRDQLEALAGHWAKHHEKALSHLAHELQQPLTAIQMLVDSIQADGARPVAELVEECELVSNQVFVMADLIEAAREVARAESEAEP